MNSYTRADTWRGYALAAIACLCLALTPASAHADTTAAMPGKASATPIAPEADIVLQPDVQEKLRQVVDAIERQQRQLSTLQQQRNTKADAPADPELDKAIAVAQKQLDDLRQQFIEFATDNYELLHNDEPQQLDINLQQEILQVIYPLLREMKQLSDRPRVLEKISSQISFYQQRAEALDKGLNHLREVIAHTNDRTLLGPLRKLETTTTNAQTEVQQKLDSLQRRQADLESDSPPLWSSLGSALRDFTTGMGWHVLIALALSVATYLLVQLLSRLPMPLLERRKLHAYTFIERSVFFLARVLGTLLAATVLLIALYSQGEWVLLGVAVILVLGALFGMKNLLPNYLVEIRTVLNLGSVRQDERLIYNGLSWRIADLDFYTTLHNPALSGVLRVPLTQICKLSSRPFHSEEPWFPTAERDWVQMSDGIKGWVVRQTPEFVQLNVGESEITYRTEKFLEGRPQNLTKGFAVSSIFGLDYQHQSEVLTTIEPQLQAYLQQAITQQDFAASCVHIIAEFASASASSLDFRLVALFKGEAAEHHGRIQRWLQRAALECSNANGWEIPFPQMRLHTQTHPAAPQPAETPAA